MKGLMTKLENMFVAATFAEVGEFETAMAASTKVSGRFLCLSNRKEKISKNDINLYEEIVTVARDLYERSGRIEGRDLDNWLEAERIVRTLRKIAGDDGKRYFLVNVPEARYAQRRKNGMQLLSFLRREPVERSQKSLRRYT
jgi:hypothetical protein